MKVCLGLHDFRTTSNLDLLLKLKEHFLDFKVSLFTIPMSGKAELEKHLDWMQFIPHGLYHGPREALEWDYAHFKHEVVPAIEAAFKENELPLTRGFAAPHWRWSNGVVKALDDLEWFGCISPARPGMLSTQRFYTYDYPIDEPFYNTPGDVLRLHGHITTTRNALGPCFDNLMKLPKDVEWRYVTDFLEENYE